MSPHRRTFGITAVSLLQVGCGSCCQANSIKAVKDLIVLFVELTKDRVVGCVVIDVKRTEGARLHWFVRVIKCERA